MDRMEIYLYLFVIIYGLKDLKYNENKLKVF